MSVITSFTERKREKQLINERKLLSDLSIHSLKKVYYCTFMQQDLHRICLMKELRMLAWMLRLKHI